MGFGISGVAVALDQGRVDRLVGRAWTLLIIRSARPIYVYYRNGA